MSKYSNNSGNAIHIFIPRGIYYSIDFSCPDSNSFDVAPYHPKNQRISYSEKEFKNSRYSNGETIIFTPEDWQNGRTHNIRHGCFTVKGRYQDEYRKTRDITQDFPFIPFSIKK